MHIRIRQLVNIEDENRQENLVEDVYLTVLKSSTIEYVQKQIEEKFKVAVANQKLYHKGKELQAEYRIVDYNICLNDVIQLVAKYDKPSKDIPIKSIAPEKQKVVAKSQYYKIGDKVDLLDDEGFWTEAKVTQIFSHKPLNDNIEENLIFQVKIDRQGFSLPTEVDFNRIRPRSFHKCKKNELKTNEIVLVNYSIENPSEIGYWYDFLITKINQRTIRGNLLHENIEVSIKSSAEIYRIEKPTLLSDKTKESTPKNIPLRSIRHYCDVCLDDLIKQCTECSCTICHMKENHGILILCDECNKHYHLKCLDPPLSSVPDDLEWFCTNCKRNPTEIVQSGAPLKVTKAVKQKVADWGKGMACVSRTTECTLVGKTHFGPIPGIEVGTCWKYRIQVSEAGVHRPHMAGIHGRENDGAYSLILSGGYEDDIDNGNEFFYTGSGGRDLSAGKRTNCQSFDQKLTRMNKALAMNCNADFNDKEGAEALDWQKGKPVRVVRNYKLGKHSKYAPKDGNRYDGIYKVVKYYPQRGKSGFLVWRYLLRRDDSDPAPWETHGREFDMIYPAGYCEAKAAEKKPSVKHKATTPLNNYIAKKMKIEIYTLPKEIDELIKMDGKNENVWKNCLNFASKGKQAFLQCVEENFMCLCCRELVCDAVTTTCQHNICKECLKRSFQAEVYSCPMCRFDFTPNYKIDVNVYLSSALKLLFPGYDKAR